MKIIKSKAYLITSSAYLGIDQDIVKVYANVANTYNAEIIHLGSLLTSQEEGKLNKIRQLLKYYEEKGDVYIDDPKSVDQIEEKMDKLEKEAQNIEKRIIDRATKLVNEFGKLVTFIVPPYTPKININNAETVYIGKMVSKYLYLSGVHVLSDKTTITLINSKIISYLKSKGSKCSWIVPHPVPSVTSLPRPGLNQTHAYYTVGSLCNRIGEEGIKSLNQNQFMPCAILVIVDQQTGEFFAQQLFIDYLTVGNNIKKPMVLHDGYVFFANHVKDVKSIDKLVASWDDHAPYTHPGVLGCIKQCVKIFEPAWYVNGGDACDMESVNRHVEHLKGKTENKRIINDIMYLLKLLNFQSNYKSIKYRIMLDSNHHEWLTRFVDKNPEIKGILDWDSIAKNYFPKWRFILSKPGEQEIFMFGDYTLRHGHQELNLRKAELTFSNGKYIRGHTHAHNSIRRAISVGCGTALAPDYTNNQINCWQSMFITMTKYRGTASVSPKAVFHDKKRRVSRFAFRDKIIECEHCDIFMNKVK